MTRSWVDRRLLELPLVQSLSSRYLGRSATLGWSWVAVEIAQNQAGAQLLERIVDSEQNLVLLETDDPEALVDPFRQLCKRSGQALYVWRGDTGLTSLRDGDMLVPGSKRLTDALRFVRRSMHFGIYLMQNATSALRPQDMALLLQIARLRDGPARRVVLMGANKGLNESLEALCMRLSISGGDQPRPRLRDGRWVQ